MLQSTWMDLVLGVDIHIMLVPTPAGPVPTPLPHPFTGLVLDPAGAAMNAAMGGGVVLVNGLFVTNCGTGVMNIPPHLPVPGPFAKGKPENDAELWFGALNVSMGGSLAVRLGDIALSCSDPVSMPTSVVIAIPKGPLVIVPRPPVPDLMTIAQSLGFKALGSALKKAGKALRKFQRGAGSKFFKKVSKRLRKNKPKSRAAQKWNKAVCFLTGHPVDVATGRLITGQVDLELTGALPLRFERNYDTASSGRESPFGRGWSHSYDEAVWVERGVVVYRNEDGREIEFSTLGLPDRVLLPGGKLYEPCERLTLEAHSGGKYVVRNVAGVAKHFEPVRAAPPGRRVRVANLVTVVRRSGVAQRLAYDEFGRLASVTDDAGRVLAFEYGRIEAKGAPAGQGAPAPKQNLERISKVSVRGTDGAHHLVGEYEYDAEGDLVAARDALGHAYRYEYVNHLLVKETDKNGLSFYFQYDGIDASAKCIRTWGDGGIYDHVITYDVQKRITLVENSLGENTLYQMDEAGQVVSVTDAAGRVTRYEYDEESGQVTKTIDPAGGVAAREYDERGNLARIVAPDGATLAIEYTQSNLPERLTDALGNVSHWAYSLEGQLIERVDPLGARSRLHWEGARLVALVNAAGQQFTFEYDESGNVRRLVAPGGVESHWHHDGLGRCHTLVDTNGNRQTRERDALGRIVAVEEPDGNLRRITYDAQSNVVHARDQHHTVDFEYRGVGRLFAREENQRRVEFDYDTEERLIAIRNEHGSVYRFELGPGGDVLEEYGFGGLRRRYLRDGAGRVIAVRRAQNRTTKYAYDAVGRVTSVIHDDGTQDVYGYRPDGELVLAENAACHIELERDALGRVVEERRDRDWIRSEYDVLGFRIRVTSSKRFEQKIHRNAMGDVLSIEAGIHSLPSSPAASSAMPLVTGPYRVDFQRDRLGLELQRQLPGGVRARWNRDALGRPVSHELAVAGNVQTSRSYRWEPNDRLKAVVDSSLGTTRFGHDELGNMTSIVHADREIELRLPDAVGNLFKSPDKMDRTYGPAGELLTSTDADGITRYQHDAEGYLREKREPGDRVWKYDWNGSGMLARVERPDGEVVEFAYDPLGRRISKTYRGKTTRWLWDGNVPLHEWVELTAEALERDGPTLVNSYEREIAAAKRAALLVRRPAQGPPDDEPLLEGTSESPITWLFAPETFAPMAKLVGDERYSIICDHLGVPRAMFDIAGERVWAAEIGAYGELRDQHGPRRTCPFRWPGQYEDSETGLYYNRFRYYDPGAGQYICSDPAGLAGGIRFFAYVRDPLTWADPFGLENIVFRALNPTDMSRLDAGESIAPKNPAANATPLDHVFHGSDPGYGDQFVSVTKDRGLAESWARTHGTEVAEIDLDKVSSPVLDLSTGTGRTTHLGDASRALPGSKLYVANQYARGAKEMLVEGEIPREAVVRRYCS